MVEVQTFGFGWPWEICKSGWEQLTVGDNTWGRLGDDAVVLVGDDAIGAAVRVVEAWISVGAAASSSALVALESASVKRSKRVVEEFTGIHARLRILTPLHHTFS